MRGFQSLLRLAKQPRRLLLAPGKAGNLPIGLRQLPGRRDFGVLPLLQVGVEALHALHKQPHLDLAQAVRELPVADRVFGLLGKRLHLGLKLPHNAVHMREVVLRVLELAVRLQAAVTVLLDARGLLQKLAPVLGLAREQPVNLTLTDHRVGAAPHSGVEEQFVDVPQAARNLVDEVLAVAGAVRPARDSDFLKLHRKQAGGVVHGERDLRQAHGLALRAAAENDVLRASGPKVAHVRFAHDPRDCVPDVALAGAVRADDSRYPRRELDLSWVGKRLEAADFQFFQAHGSLLLTTPARWPRTVPTTRRPVRRVP